MPRTEQQVQESLKRRERSTSGTQQPLVPVAYNTQPLLAAAGTSQQHERRGDASQSKRARLSSNEPMSSTSPGSAGVGTELSSTSAGAMSYAESSLMASSRTTGGPTGTHIMYESARAAGGNFAPSSGRSRTSATSQLTGMRTRVDDHGDTPSIQYTGDPGFVMKLPSPKMVLMKLKHKPDLPKNYVQETWEKLKAAVCAIHANQPIASLEVLYQACENLCRIQKADWLYVELRYACEVHVRQELEKLKSNTSSGSDFLKAMNKCWLEHKAQMGLIRSIFLYLDRTYVFKSMTVASLWEMGLDLFRKYFMPNSDNVTAEYDTLCFRTTTTIGDEIERERNGEQIDRALLKSVVQMYIDLSIYTDYFEKPFLKKTLEFYTMEGTTLIDSREIPEYLKHVKNRLKEEEDRVSAYLDRKTYKPVILLVEHRFLLPHIPKILEKGFDKMMNMLVHEGFNKIMDNTKMKDLRLLCKLFERVQKVDHLRTAFGVYIKKQGTAIVMDVNRDIQMVEDLLGLKYRLDEILAFCFRGNEAFSNTLKDSFESFINQRQNKPAELIAKYVDRKLRSGNKSMNDEELEEALDDVLILFRYIQGKDIFEAFYKRDLAKRLLLSKSASSDAEKLMLEKLKQECGAGFTGKLEGMFKDIDISRDIMMSFHGSKYSDEIKEMKIDLYVNVLTAGFWPTYPPAPVNLPSQMSHCQEVFRSFYLAKHAGRNLTWQNSLGHCVLAASFPKRNKELVVSLFQAVVLLLFNNVDSGKRLPYKDIKDLAAIEPKELCRTLQSLACGKVRVLVKHPRGRDINEEDEFSFNEDFDDKLFRIKINAIQLKETPEEHSMTTERVFLDRQYQVDAALVRIMKMRKTLTHNQLITELLAQLRFRASVADIKKRIESLIDREYLERDKDDASKLNYLA